MVHEHFISLLAEHSKYQLQCSTLSLWEKNKGHKEEGIDLLALKEKNVGETVTGIHT